MPGMRRDWRRARHEPFHDSSLTPEISAAKARADVAALLQYAEREKRAVEICPRTWTELDRSVLRILNGLNLKRYSFEPTEAILPAQCVFSCGAHRVRLAIYHGQSIGYAFSESADGWTTMSVSSHAIERKRDEVAFYLKRLLEEPHFLEEHHG